MRIFPLVYVLGYICLFFSCQKNEITFPKISDDETGNTSIMELKKQYKNPGTFWTITEDIRISGIVIANDENGNFYKKIIIQDSSGGIAINIDGYELYKEYPIGRKLNINCKNLTLNDYAHSINLGFKINEDQPLLLPIPRKITGNYIKKGGFDYDLKPRLVTISQLSTDLHDSHQNTLVKLEGLQPSMRDKNKTLADPNKRWPSSSYTLYDCQGNILVLRTSSYSNLASEPLPTDNGSIIGIFTPYFQEKIADKAKRDEKNITLRNINELDFSNPRCNNNPEELRKAKQKRTKKY